MTTVRLYANFRAIAGPHHEIPGDARRPIREIVAELIDRHPGLAGLILDETGNLQRYVSLFVDGRDIRHLDGLTTLVDANARVAIFPPSAGG